MPFLDHEVVECAAAIPAEFKTPHGGKYVIKEAARHLLPAEMIDRPKGSFPVPALVYLRGPYSSMARDGGDLARGARARAVQAGLRRASCSPRPKQHITPLKGSELWQIALLEIWLQTHVGQVMTQRRMTACTADKPDRDARLREPHARARSVARA